MPYTNLLTRLLSVAFALLLAASAPVALSACSDLPTQQQTWAQQQAPSVSLAELPAYSGSPCVTVNGGFASFSDEDRARGSFEEYAELDALGRCGTAYALVGLEIMPSEDRGSIGMVKPSGWQIAKYDFVDGGYLYNRCHLIGYQLAGENANERNLITGTRYMNVQGMEPLEHQVATYVKNSGNHVLYRATPVFKGDELVARGVLLEAESVEDAGAGVRFCEYCYNVQPGVEVDYATGDNHAVDGAAEGAADGADVAYTYVLNTNTKRFHRPDCSSVADISVKNKRSFSGTRDEAIACGYKPCGVCKP